MHVLDLYICVHVESWYYFRRIADITQEVASRGMGLVYDMSEASQKEALVGMLVGTLLEGRKYVMFTNHSHPACILCNNTQFHSWQISHELLR